MHLYHRRDDPIWLAQARKRIRRKNLKPSPFKCHRIKRLHILTKLPRFYYLFGFLWFQLRWFWVFFLGSSLGTSIGFCNFLYQGAFRELSHRFRWRKFTGRFVGGDFVGRFFSCLQVFLSEAFFCLPKRIDLIRKKGGILRHDHII